MQVHVDQRIGLLRCLELIRIYAAAHDGGLPDRLGDAALPIPIDPVIGKPFDYRRDGNKASLHGAAPIGMEHDDRFSRVFSISIQK